MVIILVFSADPEGMLRNGHYVTEQYAVTSRTRGTPYVSHMYIILEKKTKPKFKQVTKEMYNLRIDDHR